jgi:hypothetical protein
MMFTPVLGPLVISKSTTASCTGLLLASLAVAVTE